MSEVRFSSQWAMAERGTMAPVVVAAVVVAPVATGAVGAAWGAAGSEAEAVPAGEDEAMPVRVPDPSAAAFVDSPLAAAMAAMLAGTGRVVDDAALVVKAEELTAETADEFAVDVVLLVTRVPPEVANTAGDAEERALLGTTEGVEPAAAVVVAAGAVVVLPRVGTDAAAPVAPLLM